jgi:hypothetical protein
VRLLPVQESQRTAFVYGGGVSPVWEGEALRATEDSAPAAHTLAFGFGGDEAAEGGGESGGDDSGGDASSNGAMTTAMPAEGGGPAPRALMFEVRNQSILSDGSLTAL